MALTEQIINFHTKRTVKAVINRSYDTRYVVPVSNVDYSDLNITLGSHTLSDTFSLQTPLNPLDIDYEVRGTLQDFDYWFKVESVSERNRLFSFTGRYSTDKLKYTYYRLVLRYSKQQYEEEPKNVSYSSRALMELLARGLGLTLVYQAWDWLYPVNKLDEDDYYYYFGLTGTYGSLIANLFGWLGDLPHIDFNVFIRTDKLYVIQRGQETGNTVTVSDCGFPYSVTKNRVHTEWNGSGGKDEDKQEDPDNMVPFSGTIQWGDVSITYENGYVMRETDGNGNETTYTYIEHGDVDGNMQTYLKVKETLNATNGTASKTEYEYQDFGTEYYLSMETVYTDGDYNNGHPDYSSADVAITTHTPIGNGGWYGHTTKDADGEILDTGLSQGAPGNSVSQYMVDKTQEAFKSLEVEIMEEIIAGILRYLHPPLINTNYPVKDRQTIERLVDATDWLNNRIEERVSLEVLNSNHIFDFNDIIRFRDHDYHLETNNIRHSAEYGLRQAIEIVRWY